MTIAQASTKLTNLNQLDTRVLEIIGGEFTDLYDAYNYPATPAVDRITAQLRNDFTMRGVDESTLRQDVYFSVKHIGIRCRALMAHS
jgi:hypothetical protein